jgi:pimeloyl-ACP methyl ester carboxylesterase
MCILRGEMGDAAFTVGSVTLADGRRLALTSAGREDGFPVVYLHGAIGSPLRPSDALARVIDELGLRWLCVQRPGFGDSDPAPGRTLLGFAADMQELAAQLGMRRLAVLGVSAGGPYALACAYALPRLVGAAAVCSSLSPLCAPYAVAGLALHLRMGLRLLARAPGPCSAVLDGGLRVGRRHPRLVARAMTVGAPATDRALLADADARTTAVGGLLAASAGGARGLVEDYLVCCRPWGFATRDIGVEVHVWHGTQDALVPVEHAWQLAASLPSCRAAFDPDEGHFFFRRRVDDIVTRLAGAARRVRAPERM